MMANPEFGTDWKTIEDSIRQEAELGFDGCFGGADTSALYRCLPVVEVQLGGSFSWVTLGSLPGETDPNLEEQSYQRSSISLSELSCNASSPFRDGRN